MAASTICQRCARQARLTTRPMKSSRHFTTSSRLLELSSETLLPSVQFLLHEHGISKQDAADIPASGPHGRLLKGDVLAYIGQIDKAYPQEQAERIGRLSHLDLSNIKIASPKRPEAPAISEAQETQEPEDTEIAMPISLAAALACQKRLQETLGISLPLTTFIARAIELANDDLPRASGMAPSADELFESIIGSSMRRSATSRGSYLPSIVTLPPASASDPIYAKYKQPDIIDILSGVKATPAREPLFPFEVQGGGAQNVFSVNVGKGEEQRATVFLERMKAILELEPGRLVL